MFGMGVGELLLIFIIALLVFGPDKLPQVARNIGKTVGDLKRATNDIRYSIEREINMSELKQTLDLPAEVKRQMKDIVLPPDEVARRKARVERGEPPVPPEHDPYAGPVQQARPESEDNNAPSTDSKTGETTDA